MNKIVLKSMVIGGLIGPILAIAGLELFAVTKIHSEFLTESFWEVLKQSFYWARILLITCGPAGAVTGGIAGWLIYRRIQTSSSEKGLTRDIAMIGGSLGIPAFIGSVACLSLTFTTVNNPTGGPFDPTNLFFIFRQVFRWQPLLVLTPLAMGVGIICAFLISVFARKASA